MYVNTNVAALNAWQNLNNTQQSLTQVLQQLSSGNRINSAADDPAGLAISQQMMTQINGMQQAYTDSQSGISLLQTADGALGQIQNILQSMRSLASEAATATNNSTDLSNIQTEMNQYAGEITQITNNTQFNSVNLLGGGYTSQNIQVGANQNQTLSISLSAADAYTLGVSGQTATLSGTDNITNSKGISATGFPTGSYSLEMNTTAWSATSYATTTMAGVGSAATAFTTIAGTYNGTSADNVVFQVATTAGATTVTSITYTDSTHTSATTLATFTGSSTTVFLDGVTFTTTSNVSLAAASGQTTYTVSVQLNPTQSTSWLAQGGATIAGSATTLYGNVTSGTGVALSTVSEAMSFNTGTNVSNITSSADQFVQYATIAAGSAGAAGAVFSGTTLSSGTATLVTDSLNIATVGQAASAYSNGTGNASVADASGNMQGINVSTQSTAAAALSVIDTAINTLSTERANVGAYQNRLQFAASDLQTSQQNLQAAKAGITEADMALEMANLTRDQILQQSGVAMLAQANAMPQALLKLLP